MVISIYGIVFKISLQHEIFQLFKRDNGFKLLLASSNIVYRGTSYELLNLKVFFLYHV